MAEFPNRVNELRRERDWSQQHLADIVGCSKMQVSGIERGKREFSLSMMRRFAKALGVTPGELLHPDDNPLILTDQERELIERLRYAQPEKRDDLLKVADALMPFRGFDQDAA